MIGSQDGSSGRFRLRPGDRGTEKEGGRIVASVTLHRPPRGRLRLCPGPGAGAGLSTEEGYGGWDVGGGNGRRRPPAGPGMANRREGDCPSR